MKTVSKSWNKRRRRLVGAFHKVACRRQVRPIYLRNRADLDKSAYPRRVGVRVPHHLSRASAARPAPAPWPPLPAPSLPSPSRDSRPEETLRRYGRPPRRDRTEAEPRRPQKHVIHVPKSGSSLSIRFVRCFGNDRGSDICVDARKVSRQTCS